MPLRDEVQECTVTVLCLYTMVEFSHWSKRGNVNKIVMCKWNHIEYYGTQDRSVQPQVVV